MTEIVWKIDCPVHPTKSPKRKEATLPQKPKESLNPGVAVSLSLLFGGLGQFYNGQIKLGFFYFLFMLNVCVITTSIISNWSTINGWFKTSFFTHSHFAILYGLLLILGVGLWAGCAVQAYLKALGSRSDAYSGTTRRFLPSFCSFIIPGWGQFLNGQTRKGVVFLAVASGAFLGLISTLGIILLWENFQSAGDRLFWERVLIISFIPILSAPFLWIISMYDALVVSLDEVKKEPLKNRLEYANNRRRMKGWKAGFVYPILTPMIFSGLLILAGVLGYTYFPKTFYLNALQSAKVELERKNMVILPGWFDRGQAVIASM